MKYKIVWRRFEWQKVGRFWLHYFHPGVGEWRYTYIAKFFKVYKDCLKAEGWDEGFRAGRASHDQRIKK